ncbi:hypothetical protein M4D55_25305 [Metabacillus idriensis]|uniref:hypothetical protein n=1 Tax=Metabacillus idriensis TaxID=324768 RepID=UPI00203E5489|nr:hypothetical protein [Metabacillus idriensis]MCM3599057.1 hypothetical protein [Metabacillus idriensis]
MKKISFVCCSLFILFFYFVPTGANALTFDTLPIKQTSKQWSVRVGEAIDEKENVKPVKGKFHTYSLEVDNIGKDAFSVEINMFRNEPNSKTKFSLFSCPEDWDCNKDRLKMAKSTAKQLNDGMPYKFQNFLLAKKATELEVEIIWTQDKNGRPLKETFTFTAEN